MSQFANMLAQSDAVMAEVPEEEGYKSLPVGEYEATITAARVGKAPWESDDLYLYVGFSTSKGTDDTYIKLTSLTTAAAGGVKKALRGLGYEGPLAELEDHLEEMIGAHVQMRVAQNGKYTNYYFNKFLGKGSPTGDADDDLPF